MRKHRTQRLSEEIRRIISETLLMEIKDPRITDMIVSVTGVEVTRDGSYAKCYFTVLPKKSKEDEHIEETVKDEQKNDIMKGLISASGIIRREIGRQMKIRHVPELIFKFDTSDEYGRRIDKLIDEIEIPKEDEYDDKH